MKLLFDQNLSPRLAKLLSELYPDSNHVYLLGLDRMTDKEARLTLGHLNFDVIHQVPTYFFPPYRRRAPRAHAIFVVLSWGLRRQALRCRTAIAGLRKCPNGETVVHLVSLTIKISAYLTDSQDTQTNR